MAELNIPLIQSSNLEVINLKIGAILRTETDLQVQLADEAGLEPSDFDLEVMIGSFNPLSFFGIDSEGGFDREARKSVVNIWHDSGMLEPHSNNTGDVQNWEHKFNIDCYAVSQDGLNPTSERVDTHAFFSLNRTVRLVRGILMHSKYTTLDLTGIVRQRKMEKMEVHRPEMADKSVVKIIANRLTLCVNFVETLTPAPASILEELGLVTRVTPDGGIIISKTIAD